MSLPTMSIIVFRCCGDFTSLKFPRGGCFHSLPVEGTMTEEEGPGGMCRKGARWGQMGGRRK